jgi:transposase
MKWSKMPEWNECPELLLKRLPNMISELELFEKELREWQEIIHNYQDRDGKNAKDSGITDGTSETVMKLQQFKGVGERLSRHLPWEIGDFRRFGNGKQFAAFFGLTPCPFASGTMNREQGISKAGRKSLRKMAVECAWLWYRWQPESRLVKKWKDRLEQKGRIRRTAIVAMARQLMVALWRYVVKGEEIQGAIINKPVEA